MQIKGHAAFHRSKQTGAVPCRVGQRPTYILVRPSPQSDVPCHERRGGLVFTPGGAN